MQKSLVRLGALLFVLLPCRSFAQAPEGGALPEWMRQPLHRFALVLEHRADLALSAEQAGQLEALNAALVERNKPLEDEAKSILDRTRPNFQDATVVERDAARANFERVRKVREQVQKNDKDAWKDGAKLLTRDQKKKADRLISDREQALKGPTAPFRGQRGGPMSGRRPPGSPQ